MNMKILQYQVNICFFNLDHLSVFSCQLTFYDIHEVLRASFDNQLQNIHILCYTAGQKLSVLPVEPKLGKMLILGAIFNCLNPIMTVVAGLSVRDPFLMPFDRRDVRSLPFNCKWNIILPPFQNLQCVALTLCMYIKVQTKDNCMNYVFLPTFMYTQKSQIDTFWNGGSVFKCYK